MASSQQMLDRYLSKVEEVQSSLLEVMVHQTASTSDISFDEFCQRHQLFCTEEPINRLGTLGYVVYMNNQRLGWVSHENGKIRAEVNMGILP